MTPRDLPAHMATKIRVEDGHWLWVGSLDQDGYGFVWEWATKRSRRAHRIAYEALVGPIPDGLVIDHLCRVTNCVNPAHLEPVTNAENVRRGNDARGIGKGRTHCAHGHDVSSPNASYTPPSGGWRCRECERIRNRRLYRKHAARTRELTPIN